MQRKKLVGTLLLLAAAFMMTATYAQATEGGGSAGANGTEDFNAGAVPPPGFYYLNYLTYYAADNLKDDNGNTVPIAFNVKATANVSRFIYVTDYKILGANLGMQTLIPLVNLNVTTPGGHHSAAGLGDILVTPALLAWHTKNFHAVTAIDVFMPTGDYDKDTIANIGRNYFTMEAVAAGTYISDTGIELSTKLMYDVNSKNHKTDYQTGDEFHADYLLGYHLNKFKLGINGFVYKQITDDGGSGATNGNKGQVFGLGPAFSYNYKDIDFAVKYQKEFLAENRAEGQKVWFKLAMRF